MNKAKITILRRIEKRTRVFVHSRKGELQITDHSEMFCSNNNNTEIMNQFFLMKPIIYDPIRDVRNKRKKNRDTYLNGLGSKMLE